jgi:PHD/YefM family antitoxin component YafN of YafNO toxin-antitoxin module
MRAGVNTMNLSGNLLNFTEHLVSISDFSKGKTSRIFDDVKNNNTEYVVLKNNQPTAILVSMEMYKELVEKASKMEVLLESIEESRLFNLAQGIMGNSDTKSFEPFDKVVSEFGFDPDAIKKNCESVEIE